MFPSIPNVNGPCQCGSCGNSLKVSDAPAKTGKFIGQFYMHCKLCHWHYTFPPGIAPSMTVSMDRVSAATKLVKKPAQTCARKPCTKISHGSCNNGCCRLCCVMQGGCTTVKDHTSDSLSEAQQRKVQSIKLLHTVHPVTKRTAKQTTVTPHPPEPLSAGDAGDLTPAFAAFLQDQLNNHPFRQLQEETNNRLVADEAERQAAQREEEWEELDFQVAIAASRAEMLALPSSESSFLVNVASSSLHHHTPPPEPLLKVASTPAVASTFIAGIPVTKVTSKNRPTITTQMNDDWMRDYEDRTKEVQPRRGRSQIDHELTCRFRIVWWGQSNQDPAVFVVQECPHWPKWKIADSPTTLTRLGAGLVQFYDFAHPIWIECAPTYSHTVRTDGYLFLRRAGVECKDFEQQLTITIHKTPHARYFMTNERKSVKTALNIKKKADANLSSSDGEVEIIETTVLRRRQASPLKRSINQEPITNTILSKRPRLSPLIIPGPSAGSSINNPLRISDSPSSPLSPPSSSTTTSALSTKSFFPLSALSSRSTTPPILPRPTPPPAMSSPALKFADIASPITGPPPFMPGKPWPSNMYVIDMVYGFRQMDELKRLGNGKFDKRFCEVFKQDTPKTNTYHDQVRKWNSAPPALRDAALKAGRTSAGHWSLFSKAIPLKS
ncbi:hypothetical protein BYT27DRAFT_7261857 [Phlegmacium glaucopus]|nr:hypothetical protein BYT27DRAFT_7261857 [Phlegmacium glaucopus]